MTFPFLIFNTINSKSASYYLYIDLTKISLLKAQNWHFAADLLLMEVTDLMWQMER